jgi:DNA replication and repair protein RecF
MHVEHLRLTDFRNYRELDLLLPAGLVVLHGRNAQGKSNVLEAVSIAATSRSFRTNTEREVVRWAAPGHFARVDAFVRRKADTLHIEVVIADSGQQAPASATAGAEVPATPPLPGALLRKRIRVNGTPRRAMDLLGQMTVVIFAPTHLDLVVGSPSERRRFLDLILCQVHPAYCRALSQYQKIVTQRAALLRRIRDGEESPHALGYWDDQLATLAVPIMRSRADFIDRATGAAGRLYEALARDELLPNAPLNLVYRPSFASTLDGDTAEVVGAFRQRLTELRKREIAQGANVLGPHRDDMAFLAGDVDLAVYGSRGQQRTVALALKLAELDYIEQETGDQPILLLDDVLSELDAQRRGDLLEAVRNLDQVLMTVTDTTQLPAEALARAHRYDVQGGQVIAED